MSVTGAPDSLISRESLALSTPYIAPSNETEALATTTFAEVFNLDLVGLNDQFVELGGDSFLAAVLSLALSERGGIEFQPSALDELGSPREIARLIESREVAPGWLDIAKYAQSGEARPSVLKAWRTVLRHLPAPAAGNFIDDPDKDLQVVPAAEGAGAPIVFVFCNCHHRFAIPLNMIHRWLGRIGAHIVYLRDFRDLFYVMGVQSLGGDYAGSIAALRRLTEELGARSVHCMGDQAGVYGALHMGLDFGAQSVLCLTGPTDLTAYKMPKTMAKRLRAAKAPAHILTRIARRLRAAKAATQFMPIAKGRREPGNTAHPNPKIVENLRELKAELDPAMLTVRGRYESAPIYPRIRHVYGGDHNRHREQAERLAGMEGMELVPLADWPHHLVIDALLERGQFDAHLAWLLQAEAVVNPHSAARPS